MHMSLENVHENPQETSRDDGNNRSHQQLFSKFSKNLNNIGLHSLGSLFSAPSSRKHVTEEDLIKETRDVNSSAARTGECTGHSTCLNASSPSGYSCVNTKTFESTGTAMTTDVYRLSVNNSQDDYIPRRTGETAIIQGLGNETYGESTFDEEPRASHVYQSLTRHTWTRTGERGLNNNGLARPAPYHKISVTSAPPTFIEAFPSPASFDTYASRSMSSSTISSSGGQETPPLSPDTFSTKNNYVLPAIPEDSGIFWPLVHQYPFQSSLSSIFEDRTGDEDDDNEGIYLGSQLEEVKEGKKPEQCIDTAVHEEPTSSSALADDHDEWYGLEYTLELSSRERQPSNSTQSCSGGEHSKSRESWAAIHRGMVHPFFEDEDYHQWKNWHRFLDHQEDRKKHKRGYEFKALSKDRARLYVDEIRTRNVLYWQKEVFGVVARNVKERLLYIVQRRPDPYFPPHKHNWSWYLKHSRSAACLRELKPRESVVN